MVEGGNTEEGNPPYEETGEQQTKEPSEPAVATCGEKYTYEDVVEVEVTKINHGKVTRATPSTPKPRRAASTSASPSD